MRCAMPQPGREPSCPFGMTKTDVSGIGDAASLSGMQNTWTLSVRQGNNVIVLTVYGAKSPDQQRSSEESLARLALKHL